MATKNTVSFSTILKRSTCLNSINESTAPDSDRLYENLQSLIELKKNGRDSAVQRSLQSFIESLCYSANASNHFREPLYLMEQFNSIDPEISNRILSEYTTRVMPYVSDLSYIDYAIKEANLTLEQKAKIMESATAYNVADRILRNHDSLSKRFNIETEVKKYPHSSLKSVAENCAMMIDTYKIKPYQKLNLCIEEVSYLLNKNNLNYDTSDLVKYVAEYFLLNSPYVSDKEFDNYRSALTESYILNESDVDKVDYLIHGEDKDSTVASSIHSFILSNDRTPEGLKNTVDKILSSSSKLDIITNIDDIIYMIWDVTKSGMFEDNTYFWKPLLDNIVDHFNNNDYNREDIQKITDNLKSVYNDIYNTATRFSTIGYTSICTRFTDYILAMIKKLDDLKSLLYPESNIDAMMITSESVIPLNEFKIFKFHNLVKAAFNLDKFLQKKAQRIRDGIGTLTKKAKNVLFGESTDIYDYITDNHQVDIIVSQFKITNESDINSIHDFLSESCSTFNDLLLTEGKSSIKAYYIINPGFAEVHIKESAIIDLTEDEQIESDKHIDPFLESYIEEYASIAYYMDNYENVSYIPPVMEQCISAIHNEGMDNEFFATMLEALSYLDISQKDIKVLGERFIDSKFNNLLRDNIISEATDPIFLREETAIHKITDNWSIKSNPDYTIQLEAYQILQDILEASFSNSKSMIGKQKLVPTINKTNKPSIKPINNKPQQVQRSQNTNKNQQQAEKKEPPRLRLNDVKLALLGIKKKFHDMNSKQQQASKAIDMFSRRLVKGMKDALISDKRESIIKGSVIPSFSKCLKIGIVLAGLGIVTANPAIPLIAALGGFALSKKLTNKERILLLDDIEIELQVVDKEIAMAESKNQIKKYRYLLKYKKDLQRQYQRIKYNIRVGKDILPGSTVGTKNFDED